MNVETYDMTRNNNHFGDSAFGVRVIASAEVYCLSHSHWQIVKRASADSVAAVTVEADCWLLAAVDLSQIDIEMVLASSLPLVIIADAVISAPWLDLADGFVLPDDDPVMVATVLFTAVAPQQGQRVAEFSDGTARTINALSQEAGRIAEQLARLAEAERAPPQRGRVDATLVRRLIKLRRDRERFFPADIFADPAWDMLLDLVAARLEGKRVPVSSLCIAAAVPSTTALRWIRSLTEAGIFVRQLDPDDARRSHVEIAPAAADAMLAYLQAFAAVFALR